MFGFALAIGDKPTVVAPIVRASIAINFFMIILLKLALAIRDLGILVWFHNANLLVHLRFARLRFV
jgi:hypothetical protein